MIRKKQPARMGRYTNIGNVKASRRKFSPKRPKRFAWFWRLSRKQKIALIGGPILAALIIIPLVTYAMLARDIADQDRLMNRNNTGLVLTDTNGETFYSIGKAEHRNMIPLAEISEHTKEALIAAEDKDFYKHSGFNILSIFRAAFTRVGGGSTITQQLAKNTLLSDQQTFLRKYQELFMSIAIEQHYTKDQILEMYLNSVYYGENAFGIEDAAKAYYNKSPKDLDLAESAMLIGLLPAPSAYSPISGNAEYAKQRQTTVLTRMVNNGFITEAEKTAALGQELAYGEGAAEANSEAPHFAEMVINELSEQYGYERVMRSGYQVRTSLDLAAQRALNENVASGMRHVSMMGGSNAGGVVIDPKTGEVRALVGSVDYGNEQWGKVNMVTTARQPGSSFKPVYYAAALADGTVTPATLLDDKVIDFGGGYMPRDADRNESSRGQMSVRKSLAMSLNIPSVHVMRKYGISKSVDAAHNLGIDAIKKDANHGLALALGSAEAPLMQMTNAYAAFANGGQQFDPVLISRINDKFNKEVFTSKNAKPEQAISREGAFLISNILSDNNARAPIFGGSLTVPGKTVAVKTGTTNDSRDAWTIGYTPSYAVGVWVGNNDNTAMRSGGSDMAGPIWRGTMQKLLQNKPNEQFQVPGGIVQRPTCQNGGIANRAGEGTFNEYFVAGALPTTRCVVEEKKVTVCDLDTKQLKQVNESEADAGNYSRNESDCRTKQITVCDTEAGRVVTIDEDDFDSSRYSRQTANCQAAGNDDDDASQNPDDGSNTGNNPGTGNTGSMTVCDTTTGQVVTIPVSQYSPSRYSMNTTNCQRTGA